MVALLIHAHPVADSYSSALADSALHAMKSAKVEHRLVCLCQGDPAGQDLLERVSDLVIVAPTWWGGMPAQLLDWVQKLIGPTVDHQAGLSPLREVRTLTVVSTHGSTLLKNLVQGQPGLQLWKRAVLPVCSADAVFRWVALYNVDRGGPVKRERFVHQVREEITSVLTVG